jgi:hypothetical protein
VTSGPWPDEELGWYLEEPTARPAAAFAGRPSFRRLAELVDGDEVVATPVVYEAPSAPTLVRRHDSTTFLCLLPLPGHSLAAAVEEWWRRDVRDGVVDLGRRLRLTEPQFRPDLCGGWHLDGRFRHGRLTRLPMTLELSPRLSYGTLVHLRPDRRVAASSRYFALGHAVIRELAEALLTATGAASG